MSGSVLNDGTTDAAGRFWIGSVGRGREPDAGSLLRIELDGTSQVVATGFALSNGLGRRDRIAARGPPRQNRLTALGGSGHRQRAGLGSALQLSDDDGLPDGIAFNAEGHLWVAVYGRGEVRRNRLDGRVDFIVEVPTAQATSLALGGPDGRDLLITTAREGFNDKR